MRVQRMPTSRQENRCAMRIMPGFRTLRTGWDRSGSMSRSLTASSWGTACLSMTIMSRQRRNIWKQSRGRQPFILMTGNSRRWMHWISSTRSGALSGKPKRRRRKNRRSKARSRRRSLPPNRLRRQSWSGRERKPSHREIWTGQTCFTSLPWRNMPRWKTPRRSSF